MPSPHTVTKAALALAAVAVAGATVPATLGGSVSAATTTGVHMVFDSAASGRFQLYVKKVSGVRVLLVNDPSGSDFGAAVSPGSTRIAYTRRAGGNYDLYEVPIGGGRPLRLTTSPAVDAFPAWSKQGRIAFESNRAGNFDIYVLSGGAARQMTSSRAEDGLPAWSPDGLHIAFDSNRTGHYQITRIATSGYTVAVNLTDTASNNVQPAWSPDGNEIAFSSNRSGRYQIWELNPHTLAVKQLTHGGNDYQPAWSATGTMISFVGTGTGRAQLYTMNADGSNVTAVTTLGGEQPDWIPPG
jgi:Tol biopolymer transport system component